MQFIQDHGITVEVDNVNKVFRGSTGPFSSDNLGSHAIGGYTESFNCLRICRFCMATKEDIQTKVSCIFILSCYCTVGLMPWIA